MASILDLMDSSGNVAKGGFLQGMESANKAVMDERKSLSDLALNDANTNRINQATIESEETFKSNASARELKSRKELSLLKTFEQDDAGRRALQNIENLTNMTRERLLNENPERLIAMMTNQMLLEEKDASNSVTQATLAEKANKDAEKLNFIKPFMNAISQGGRGGNLLETFAMAAEDYKNNFNGNLYEELGVGSLLGASEISNEHIDMLQRMLTTLNFTALNFTAIDNARIKALDELRKHNQSLELKRVEAGLKAEQPVSNQNFNKAEIEAIDERVTNKFSRGFLRGYVGNDSDTIDNMTTYAVGAVGNNNDPDLKGLSETQKLALVLPRIEMYLKEKIENGGKNNFTTDDIDRLSMATKTATTDMSQKEALDNFNNGTKAYQNEVIRLGGG